MCGEKNAESVLSTLPRLHTDGHAWEQTQVCPLRLVQFVAVVWMDPGQASGRSKPRSCAEVSTWHIHNTRRKVVGVATRRVTLSTRKSTALKS